jgi:L-alanine-DL-glutamate epimerase-like enolase superfamily enzyme
MHMDLEAGTRRDILVVRAVREAVGPDAKILLDANNGYNLNLTKRVLGETASAGVYWMEEPFHEDPRLYTNLKEWMTSAGIRTFIADGEGDASRNLLEWVKRGLIDVVQYDIFGHGLTRWLETGRQLDEWNARSAPHHYGSHIGNYASCHLASAVRGFEFAEWDEAETPGFDTSRYSLRDGLVTIPAAPGFGLELEESVFARMVKETGFTVGTG